jgi:hypothetical protein
MLTTARSSKSTRVMRPSMRSSRSRCQAMVARAAMHMPPPVTVRPASSWESLRKIKTASVTIITAGKGYKPVIAFRVDADEFPAKVENGTISERQIEPVELEPGATLKAPAVNGNAIQFGIMIGGITAVLLVVASLVAIRRQWSKA